MVLFILAVIWAAVLLPPYLQNRSVSRPADSISSFQHQLSVLERRANPALAGRSPGGRSLGGPSRMGSVQYPGVYGAARMSRAAARRRRRDVLFMLAGAVAFTGVLAMLLGGPVWWLQVVSDLLFVGYVYLLAQANQRQMERSSKVRPLPVRHARRPVEPALLLRRSGS